MFIYVVFLGLFFQSAECFASGLGKGKPQYKFSAEIPEDMMHQIKQATAARVTPKVMERLDWIRSAVRDASCAENLEILGGDAVAAMALRSGSYAKFFARIQAQDKKTSDDLLLPIELSSGPDYGFFAAAQGLFSGCRPESSESVSAFIARARASSQAQAASAPLIPSLSPERSASVPVVSGSQEERRVRFVEVITAAGYRASVGHPAAATPDTARFSPERAASSAAGSSGGFRSPVQLYGPGVAEDLTEVYGPFDHWPSGARLQ